MSSPTAFGVLTFKNHDSSPSYSQPAIPGEEIRHKENCHHKPHTLGKSLNDKRKMEAPTQR